MTERLDDYVSILSRSERATAHDEEPPRHFERFERGRISERKEGDAEREPLIRFVRTGKGWECSVAISLSKSRDTLNTKIGQKGLPPQPLRMIYNKRAGHSQRAQSCALEWSSHGSPLMVTRHGLQQLVHNVVELAILLCPPAPGEEDQEQDQDQDFLLPRIVLEPILPTFLLVC